MRTRFILAHLAASAGAAILIGSSASISLSPSAALADDAASDTPGLRVGDRVRDATLLDAEGNEVSLASLYAERPVVLTFYRGGWCPYCVRALDGWEKAIDEIKAAGAEFIALTPEKPERIDDLAEKKSYGFTILCDPDNEAAREFKVYFQLDAGTKKKYEGYGIDLAAGNQSGEWSLPAPGTFVIDTSGVVRYAWADWDYKQRADPDEVLDAVRGLNAASGE